MAAPKWAAGKTYLPGAVVQPLSSAGITIEPLLNPDFEAGSLTGWDVVPTGTGSASAGTGRPFAGTYAARWTGAYGGSGIVQPRRDGDGLWKAQRDIVLGLNVPDYARCTRR